MTLSLDGYNVLRLIGSNAGLFRDLKAEVARLAESLLRKQLTQRTVGLPVLTEMVRIMGEDTISLVLQTLDPADLKALCRQLDPHFKVKRGKGVASLDRHLIDLAQRRVRPVRKMAAGKKPAAKGKTRSGAAAPVPASKAVRTAKAATRREPKRQAVVPLGTGSMRPGIEPA